MAQLIINHLRKMEGASNYVNTTVASVADDTIDSKLTAKHQFLSLKL